MKQFLTFFTIMLLFAHTGNSQLLTSIYNLHNMSSLDTQNQNQPKGTAFELPKLPYAYNALEPYIDALTMQIHYEKHHGAYTNNLNNAIKDTDLAGKSIEDILLQVSKLSPAIRNNGGGYYNHNLFWSILSNNPKDGYSESLEVVQAIIKTFGSFDNFKTQFSQAAATRFGSGWAWLNIDDKGAIFISSTPNQDNPLMDIAEQKGFPLIGLDVWEHAYYLNYQNRRPDYIEAFFKIINWTEVNARYLSKKK